MRLAPLADLALLLAAATAAAATAADLAEGDPAMVGFHAYQRGDLDEAHAAYVQCVESRTDCMTNLASVLLDMDAENTAAAEQLYRRALANSEPADHVHNDAAFNLALLLHDRKDDEAAQHEAVQLYGAVIEAEPTHWGAWGNLASVAQELRLENALLAPRAYQRAILQLEEEHAASEAEAPAEEVTVLSRMYYGLGITLSEMSDGAAALRDLQPSCTEAQYHTWIAARKRISRGFRELKELLIKHGKRFANGSGKCRGNCSKP